MRKKTILRPWHYGICVLLCLCINVSVLLFNFSFLPLLVNVVDHNTSTI